MSVDLANVARDAAKERDAWRAVLSQRASEYDHLLVLRPDATFAQPIDLVSVCRAKPGFSFVSDQDVIPKRWRPDYLHHSNWDFAWVACTPDALRLWLGGFFLPSL